MTATTTDRRLARTPVAKTGMLIRRPVAEVFAAFVDPAITTKFWFTKSSGLLEPGARVRWEWAMHGAAVDVDVRAVEPNERILIEWAGDPSPTTVEWRFAPRPGGTTFVEIENAGFGGDADRAVAQALDATEGFTLVLAGLKAWLEDDLALNLVADRFPADLDGG